MPVTDAQLEAAEAIVRTAQGERRSRYLICPAGGAHSWAYPRAGQYRCMRCATEVPKNELKASTD